MTLTQADNAMQNIRVITSETAASRLALTWDRRFAMLSVMPKCRHELAETVRFDFALGGLLKAMGVKPEELRVLADELEAGIDPPSSDTTDDICLAGLPASLKGKTVLDVGGYDGRFAAECVRRGARRAVCLDSHQWEHYGWAKPAAQDGVEFIHGDLTTWTEPMDVVLFYNVLYHLEDPHAGLRHLRTITKEQMVLCTMFIWSDLPVWRVYEPREVNPTDETVYWAPSIKGLLRSLKVCGWTMTEEIGRAQERVVLRCKEA